VHAAIDDLEAERLVRAQRHLVIDPRVGRELAGAFATRPVLGRGHQRPSHRAALVVRLDVPALDEADRVATVAAVGVGAEPDLEEAHDLVANLRDEQHESKRASPSLEDERHVLLVLGQGRVRPEGCGQPRQRRQVGRKGAADPSGLHHRHPTLVKLAPEGKSLPRRNAPREANGVRAKARRIASVREMVIDTGEVSSMKRVAALLVSLPLLALLGASASAQTAPAPAAPTAAPTPAILYEGPAQPEQVQMVQPGPGPQQMQPAPPQQYGAPDPQYAPPPPPPQGATPPLPQAQQPQGQWVNTAEQGWIWVPAGTQTYAVEQVPYAYLYTPAYGWTWYASPWGWGPYAYGPWVGGAWPFGFRAWAHGPGGWGWNYGRGGRGVGVYRGGAGAYRGGGGAYRGGGGHYSGGGGGHFGGGGGGGHGGGHR